MLLTDRGQVPMNTGAILVFDTAYGPGSAGQGHAGGPGSTIPRLRQRVQRLPMGCGAPIWVDDADFAIDRHLIDREVDDRPGDQHCSTSPLSWSASGCPWTIHRGGHNLVAGSPGGHVRALVLVVHHVMADGLGGLAVLRALADPGWSRCCTSSPASTAVPVARRGCRTPTGASVHEPPR